MIMPEVACLRLSPHQVSHANGDAAIASSTLRRPRNREVTSRYKSPVTPSASPASVPNRRFPTPTADRSSKAEASTASPAPLPIRRFPTPNVDRLAHTSDVSSPKRALSVERRRPSPTRAAEHISSKGVNDTAAPIPPHRANARAELLWPSTRSLSSSGQPESSSILSTGQPKSSNGSTDQTLRCSANVVQKPVNSRRPTPERKGTPIRTQSTDQAENARPQENLQKTNQHVRDGISNGKLSGAALGRSIDLSNRRERQPSRAAAFLLSGKQANGASTISHSVGFAGGKTLSINEGSASLSLSTQKLRPESRGRRQDSPSRLSRGPNSPRLPGKGISKATPASGTSHTTIEQVVNPARLSGLAVELADSDVSVVLDTVSDTESVSSGGTTATTSSGRSTPAMVSMIRSARGTAVPARFWQDAASRSRGLPENRMHASMSEPEFAAAAQGRGAARLKTVESPQGLNAIQNGSFSSSPRSSVSSSRSLTSQQSISPSKVSPYRSVHSPVRSRGVPPLNTGCHRSSSTAMMLNFNTDVRRGRKGLSQVEEIHVHRILHNRLLQWQFVNARADGAMNEQTAGAEKLLYNVCVRISGLRSSVISKKKQLHQVRQARKLHALLSRQKSGLEKWSTLQGDHSNALAGAFQALESAVLRVPVIGGVKVDVLAVQDAVSSANDVMNLIETSAAYLLPKADESHSLVSELGNVTAQERILLEQCASLLAVLSALEVEERSIQTHLVQCERERARVLGHLMDTTNSLPNSAVV